MIQIHDSLQTANLADADPSGWKPEFLSGLLTCQPSQLITNVHTTLYLAQLKQLFLPVTINDAEYNNSYVCSPYTGMISYPRDELNKIDSHIQATGIRMLTSCLSPILKAVKINRVACVNDAMLSTNLYPNWSGDRLDDLTASLIEKFPKHAIMFRSLNYATNPTLCDTFERSVYQFVPSRLLYVIDPTDPSIPKKQNNEIDFRWLRKSPYSIVRHEEFTNDDDPRIKSLYDQLYLDKYSHCNPKFSVDLIRLFRKTGQLQFNGLRDPAGKLAGVIATLELNNQFTTPIVGYDFSIPQEDGLYRLLTTIVIQKSLTENKLFNMSSGVGRFKKHRGATPHLEYSAIYTDHLSTAHRTVWRTLGWLMKNVAAPIVQKNEL